MNVETLAYHIFRTMFPNYLIEDGTIQWTIVYKTNGNFNNDNDVENHLFFYKNAGMEIELNLMEFLKNKENYVKYIEGTQFEDGVFSLLFSS